MGATLIKGGLTIAGPGQPAERLDVRVEGNRITAVASDLDVDDGAEVVDASDMLVVPGLVNAHMHGRESLSKALVDNRPLELWLLEVAAFTEGRTAEDQYVSVALGAIEMLKGGVTSAYDLFTHIPVLTPESILAVLGAYRDVGLRALVAPSVSDIPYHLTIPGLAEVVPHDLRTALDELFPAPAVPDTMAVVREAFDDWSRQDGGEVRVRPAISPVIPERCSDELLGECRKLSEERGLGLHMHMVETRLQALQRLTTAGCTTVAYLDRAGLLGPATTLAHAVWVEEGDIGRLAERGCTVVHNPASNAKIGSGVMPLVAMRTEGVSVAVGTDGFQSMFESMRLAAYLHRLTELDHERWPTATDVLEILWDGGSHAFGLTGDLGRLAPGYLADVTLLDLDSDSLTPLNDAPAQLVLCETGSAVRAVMVDGRWVLRDGRCTLVDERAVRSRAREIAGRLARGNAERTELVGRLAPYVAAIRRACMGSGRINRLWP